MLISTSRIRQNDSHVCILYFGWPTELPPSFANNLIHSGSAISYVLAHKSRPGEIVTFFFPQFDDPQSLYTETVIRSIIRQSLDPVALSEEIEAKLAEMDQKMSIGLGELTFLLHQRIKQSEIFYIFIDALDEFEPRERRALLGLLASLGSGGFTVRVFLAGRESLSGELKEKLPGIERVSMMSAVANADINRYAEEALEERMQNQDLVIRDQSLIVEMKQALTKHADGMYVNSTFSTSPHLSLMVKVSLGHFLDRRTLRPGLRRRHSQCSRMPSKDSNRDI